MEAAIFDFVMGAPASSHDEAEELTDLRMLVSSVRADIQHAVDPGLALELQAARAAVVEAQGAYDGAVAELDQPGPAAPMTAAEIPGHAREVRLDKERRQELENAIPHYAQHLEVARATYAQLLERAQAQMRDAHGYHVGAAREVQAETTKTAQALMRRAAHAVHTIEGMGGEIGAWQLDGGVDEPAD